MEIRGKIIQVLPLQQGVGAASGKAWKKQEYVLETFDQFPRKVKFDFFGDRADQYPLQVGQDVVVSFDLESRSFVGRDGVERWSTDVRAWKAENADAALAAAAAQQPGFAAPQQVGAAPFPQAAPVYPQAAPAVGQMPQPMGGDATENLPF